MNVIDALELEAGDQVLVGPERNRRSEVLSHTERISSQFGDFVLVRVRVGPNPVDPEAYPGGWEMSYLNHYIEHAES